MLGKICPYHHLVEGSHELGRVVLMGFDRRLRLITKGYVSLLLLMVALSLQQLYLLVTENQIWRAVAPAWLHLSLLPLSGSLVCLLMLDMGLPFCYVGGLGNRRHRGVGLTRDLINAVPEVLSKPLLRFRNRSG